jgi:hypothetical protein
MSAHPGGPGLKRHQPEGDVRIKVRIKLPGRNTICDHADVNRRLDLSFVWKRPVLSAAVPAVVESGLLYILQRFVWHREEWAQAANAWFGVILYFVGFFALNLFAIMRERRRRQRRKGQVTSP